jgi:hypothetical protein
MDSTEKYTWAKTVFKNMSCEKTLTYKYTAGFVREIIIAKGLIFCSSTFS